MHHGRQGRPHSRRALSEPLRPRGHPLGARRPVIGDTRRRPGPCQHRGYRLRRAVRARADPETGRPEVRRWRQVTAITIRRPDDLHLHLRDGELMRSVLPFTAARFARALVMPNLRPPVTTTERALAYRQRILDALPTGMTFEPLMTLYLTDRTDPAEVDRAKASGCIVGFKLY